MGSGCCKSENVHPVHLNISNPLVNVSQKGLNFSEFSLQDPNSRQIHWKRGNLIGQGVYGKVFQGMDTDTGELIAIKTFTLSNNPSQAHREIYNIKRELGILKSLDHPNIIKYFQSNYCEETNSIDLVMEYIPSGSLLSLINKYKCLSESVIRIYAKQILLGIEYLHTNEIVHRDLKSANILVTEESVLKLTDFGCSRKFDSESDYLSHSFRGSPYWMAPEIVLRDGHSYPSDIWSLGCLIIEMASGKPPWSNKSNLSKEVFKLIAKSDSIPDLPVVSQGLTSFILLCLRRDPNLRPTAKELLNHEIFELESVTRSYESFRSILTARSVVCSDKFDKTNENL